MFKKYKSSFSFGRPLNTTPQPSRFDGVCMRVVRLPSSVPLQTLFIQSKCHISYVCVGGRILMRFFAQYKFRFILLTFFFFLTHLYALVAFAPVSRPLPPICVFSSGLFNVCCTLQPRWITEREYGPQILPRASSLAKSVTSVRLFHCTPLHCPSLPRRCFPLEMMRLPCLCFESPRSLSC